MVFVDNEDFDGIETSINKIIPDKYSVTVTISRI